MRLFRPANLSNLLHYCIMKCLRQIRRKPVKNCDLKIAEIYEYSNSFWRPGSVHLYWRESLLYCFHVDFLSFCFDNFLRNVSRSRFLRPFRYSNSFIKSDREIDLFIPSSQNWRSINSDASPGRSVEPSHKSQPWSLADDWFISAKTGLAAARVRLYRGMEPPGVDQSSINYPLYHTVQNTRSIQQPVYSATLTIHLLRKRSF